MSSEDLGVRKNARSKHTHIVCTEKLRNLKRYYAISLSEVSKENLTEKNQIKSGRKSVMKRIFKEKNNAWKSGERSAVFSRRVS